MHYLFFPAIFLLCSQVYVFAQDFQEVTYKGVPLEVVRAAENPVTNELAIALRWNPIVIWNAEAQTIVREFADIHPEWGSIAYSPNGSFLAGGTYDGTTVIYDAASGQALHTEVVDVPSQNLSFSPDSSQLVISGRWILDTSSYALTPLSEAYSACTGVGGAYLPQTNRLFTVGDNNYCVWDTTDLSVIAESEYVDGPIIAIAASPAGDSVVVTNKYTQPDTLILDPDGNVRHRLALGDGSTDPTDLGQAHFSADGSILALTGGGLSVASKDVIIIEPLSGEVLSRYNDTTLQSPLNKSIYGSTIISPDTLLLLHSTAGLNFISLKQELAQAQEQRTAELERQKAEQAAQEQREAERERLEAEQLAAEQREVERKRLEAEQAARKQQEAEQQMFRLAREGTTEQLKTALETGINLNIKDEYGQTPLMYAAGQNNEEVVQLLVDKGADVDQETDAGWTPLMYAARDNTLEVFEQLIDNGADMSATNNDGDTVLELASTVPVRNYITRQLTAKREAQQREAARQREQQRAQQREQQAAQRAPSDEGDVQTLASGMYPPKPGSEQEHVLNFWANESALSDTDCPLLIVDYVEIICGFSQDDFKLFSLVVDGINEFYLPEVRPTSQWHTEGNARAKYFLSDQGEYVVTYNNQLVVLAFMPH